MKKKQLVLILLMGLFLLGGCATMSSQDKPTNNDSKNVRLSGDVTVSTINRKGF